MRQSFLTKTPKHTMENERKQVILQKLQTLHQVYNNPLDIPNSNALFSGQSGIFLFRLYLQSYFQKSNEKLENDLVDFISKQLQYTNTSRSFANGLTGFAWFLQHIHHENFIELDDELLEHFDSQVFETAKMHLAKGKHDFMHGGLGDMLYLAERAKHRPQLKEQLISLLATLEALAIKSKEGIAWFETEDYLEGEEDCTVINFHISHGQASKILVLSKLVAVGIDEAKTLLLQTIRFMLAKKDKESGLIPSRLVDDKKEVDTHLGWCRSNIAISMALWQAARILEDKTLEQTAIKAGLFTLESDIYKSKKLPSDTTFCHGMAGISHMYNRFYDYTQIADFKLAANQWIDTTLSAAIFEDGIAGFKSWSSWQSRWEKNYHLLSGIAGTGLSLLAHISKDHFSWDQCFLLS